MPRNASGVSMKQSSVSRCRDVHDGADDLEAVQLHQDVDVFVVCDQVDKLPVVIQASR